MMKGIAVLLCCAVAIYAKPKSISDDAIRACARDDTESRLVLHENCNRFYECNGGKPVTMNCPNGLYFHIESQICDWPENVKCSGRTIAEIEQGYDNDGPWKPEHGYDDPSQAPALCAADGSDGVLVAHENCKQFYKCLKGEPVALSCPSNLLYQPKLEACDWPENVDCTGRIITEGNDNNGTEGPWKPEHGYDDPSQAPAICAADGSDGVLVAHENCNQFYECSEGEPVALSCPSNLLYQPKLEACDWPANVDCTGRTQ